MRHDGFLRDVLAAPDRLAAALPELVSAAGLLPRARRIVLIGMGSSRFAALPAAAALRATGIDAVAELASSDLPSPPAAGTLAIGISASGTTAETVEALARHTGTSTTVAVTNVPASALAGVADVVVPLGAGVEEGGVSCLTYQATVALLQLVVAAQLGSAAPLARLEAAVEAGAALRAGREGWLPELAERVDAAPAVHVVAPVSRIGSALQGALMLREGPRLPAAACETGDWLHVDVYLTKRPGFTALLHTGSPYDVEVVRWVRERETTVTAIGDALAGATASVELPADPLVRSTTETAVAELVAAEVWRRRVERGDPALA